jgi:hypothetical protein
MTVGDPPRWPRDTPLFAKVGTKFRRQVAVAQSVEFACGLKATDFLSRKKKGFPAESNGNPFIQIKESMQIYNILIYIWKAPCNNLKRRAENIIKYKIANNVHRTRVLNLNYIRKKLAFLLVIGRVRSSSVRNGQLLLVLPRYLIYC